jgi:D-beta-D-heptose 7-phosphate kinase / D-beta-D-heptose 1-phosphate adenosyltransferase
VVLISDYAKGLFTRSLLSKLVVVARACGKITIADPKGVDFAKYNGISLITPNRKEASMASGIDIVDEPTLSKAAKKLLEKAGVEKLLITCGKDGMVLFEPNQDPFKVKTDAREVYDVSGAGDTVVAVLGLGLAAGLSFREAITLANIAAGIVVGKIGTATVSKIELAQAIRRTPEDAVIKCRSLNELSELCRRLKQDRKRIVFNQWLL